MKSFLTGVILILIGILASGLIWLTTSPPPGEPVTLLPPSTPLPIIVHVTGAVTRPDVYALPINSRVQDALNAAGGPLPEADLSNINLAAPLIDGSQLIIPSKAIAAEDNPASETTVDRININTASVEELANLPGIGSVTAQRIVDYRTQFGPFTELEDLMNVFGIGTTTFEQIKDLITIDP